MTIESMNQSVLKRIARIGSSKADRDDGAHKFERSSFGSRGPAIYLAQLATMERTSLGWRTGRRYEVCDEDVRTTHHDGLLSHT
jgi:hypothetical protein